MVSDDLIQGECATGGLCDDESATYYFTYFPEPDVVTKWQLLLPADQILAVADGKLSELRLWRCETPRCPDFFGSENSYCSYCAFWIGENMVRPAAEDEAACASAEEWLRLFARLNPRATEMHASAAYNSTPGLEHRLGPLPLEILEMMDWGYFRG